MPDARPILYHLNHGCNDYRPGVVLSLRPFVALDNEHAAAHAAIATRWNPMFPAGFSLWGLRLLYGNIEGDDINDREIDLELLRRRYYPDRPSRFQSFFAFGSLEHAREVRQRSKKADASIWIVEAPGPLFRGDMELLGAGHHPEERLRAYWEGKALDERTAIWESLLTPPVTLIRTVEE